MAKSTRSKVKRHFRAKKREEGVYAAAEAARLNRLHTKLRAKLLAAPAQEPDEDVMVAEGDAGAETHIRDDGTAAEDAGDAMDLDAGAAGTSDLTKRISTHGPRGSRREEWRAAKGLTPRAPSKGMNRQGGIAARRKAGRSLRRR
ncbi:hypothetical protein B0H21DRAFT_717619 [Amylocystis lapponica]|nr:hypothetical protein B0H21DRAFT_717619 [Amylocystis lapponica]